jgi:hypothetical protein
MIELIWNGEGGKLQITKEFVLEHKIVKLDALQDWIIELTELYDGILEEGKDDE